LIFKEALTKPEIYLLVSKVQNRGDEMVADVDDDKENRNDSKASSRKVILHSLPFSTMFVYYLKNFTFIICVAILFRDNIINSLKLTKCKTTETNYMAEIILSKCL